MEFKSLKTDSYWVASLNFSRKSKMQCIMLEFSDMGKLLWVNTKKRINVFGLWSKKNVDRSFYKTWVSDGTATCAC